jgi:hypothetical protein
MEETQEPKVSTPKFKIDDKFKALPTHKKLVVVMLLALILGTLIFVAFSSTTEITTMKYPSGCVEIFHNQELNYSNCTEFDKLGNIKINTGIIPQIPN